MNNSAIYKKKSPLFAFLIPAFAFMAVFLYYPFVMNIINSANKISGLGTASEGINTPWYLNITKLFQDEKLRTAFGNTLLMMVLTVFIQVGIALLLALLVDNIKRGSSFFRTVYFFPIVISATALGLLFNLIFMYNGGMLNQLLMHFGLITDFIDWKDSAHYLAQCLRPLCGNM
ncbi:MAG: sugar ABC transporter permease [Oscillospiraceae bacterium]